MSKSSTSTTYPPATAGGTDPIQARRLTFEANLPGLSLRANLGLKLANAFGVFQKCNHIRPRCVNLPALKSDSEFSTDGGVGGSKYCVVTTVPNVTPNDTRTLSLRLDVRNALSPAVSLTLQT